MSKKKITNKERAAILAAREKLDVTLDWVANEIGVSQSTVSRWESGETTTIKDRDAEKLAKVLGIDLAGAARS